MAPNDLIIFNHQEIRRRSLKVFRGIPADFYQWKPDEEAMTFLESVRHVLEAVHLYHVIVDRRGNIGDYVSPWDNRPYTNLEDEIAFAQPYYDDFLTAIKAYSAEELESIEIVREALGQRRKLGDFLLRIAYHESIHTGQLLSYMRIAGIERPNIWD